MGLIYPESLEFFIINASMIGLGLSLSLYSFIIPQINKILETQSKNLHEARQKFIQIKKEYGKKLIENRDDEDLQKRYNDAKEKVVQLQEIKFHYGGGFLGTGILFALSTIFPILNVFDTSSQPSQFSNFINILTQLAPFFLIFGIIILIYVWFMVFFDIKDLIKKILDEEIAKADKELEEAEELTKSKPMRRKRGFAIKT